MISSELGDNSVWTQMKKKQTQEKCIAKIQWNKYPTGFPVFAPPSIHCLACNNILSVTLPDIKIVQSVSYIFKQFLHCCLYSKVWHSVVKAGQELNRESVKPFLFNSFSMVEVKERRDTHRESTLKNSWKINSVLFFFSLQPQQDCSDLLNSPDTQKSIQVKTHY